MTEDVAAAQAKALGAERCVHASWIRRCTASGGALLPPPRPFEILHVRKRVRTDSPPNQSEDTEISSNVPFSEEDELFPAGGSEATQHTQLSGSRASRSQATPQANSQATEFDEDADHNRISQVWQQRKEFRREKLASAAVAPPGLPGGILAPAVNRQQVKGFHTYAVVRSGTAASAVSNKWLTEQLSAIADWYSDAPEVPEDEFRSRQFGLLSSIFGGFHEMKADSDEVLDAVIAVQHLKGIKNTTVEIHDWLASGATGDMPRLARLRASPLRQDLKDLQQVWGIGLKNAQRLRSIGISNVLLLQRLVFRTVPASDFPTALPRNIVARLQQAGSDAQRGSALGLTTSAITSLPYTSQIQRRIPRAEIESLFCGLQSVLKPMYPAAIAQVCGSFRRGAPSSGDIDVLITHPDGGLLDIRPVLRVLSMCGSLVANLASPDLPPAFGRFNRSTIDKLDAAIDADLGRKQMYMGIGVDKAERSMCLAQMMLQLLRYATPGSKLSPLERREHTLQMLPWLSVAAPIETATHSDLSHIKQQLNAATVSALAGLAIPNMVMPECTVSIPAQSPLPDAAADSLYASPVASEDSEEPGGAFSGSADPQPSPVQLTKASGLQRALAASKGLSTVVQKQLVQLLPILWHIESFLGHWGPGRRVDIKSYVAPAYPFAVLYFTGSAYFNRSMRYYADNTGLTLSDTGIARVTARDKRRGIRQARAKERHLRTERDIFEFMGIPWKEPWERNCVPIDASSLAAHQGRGGAAGGGGGTAPASISPAQLLRDERCVKLMTAILKDSR